MSERIGFGKQVRWDALPYINGDGLDVGCGDSRIHDWLVGIDTKPGTTNFGPNMIKDGTKLHEYFKPDSQDFVFSSYLLQELDDWPKVLEGWWKLIKPEGHLILFLPLQEVKPAEGDKPALKASGPKLVVDAMAPLKPWQLVEARINNQQFFQVYRKTEKVIEAAQPDPEKICAVMKLGAHGDAMWASSVLPHLKEQGFYTILYCQETTEAVLRHDPHVDNIIRFESRVPMGELGELFRWLECKYKNHRILIECVEGTLLPAPTKIQYFFPKEMRQKLMNFNYVDMHHMQAQVPMDHRQKFYPSEEEKVWANEYRKGLTSHVVVLVPNGSSVSKMWPYAGSFAKRLIAEREDVTVVVLGDQRGCSFEAHERLKIIGMDWDIRKCFTFALLANVVVGEETGILNCVAMEKEVRKVVLLSHSTIENLTRDWPNTAALHGDVHCFPCHRLHYNWEHCNRNEVTKAAACQSAISVTTVLKEVLEAIPAKPQLVQQAA